MKNNDRINWQACVADIPTMYQIVIASVLHLLFSSTVHLVESTSVYSNTLNKQSCLMKGIVLNVSLPGCRSVSFAINTCLGACTSCHLPADAPRRRPNQKQQDQGNSIVDISLHTDVRCCKVTSYEEVTVSLDCWQGGRDHVVRSATSCGCKICQRE